VNKIQKNHLLATR